MKVRLNCTTAVTAALALGIGGLARAASIYDDNFGGAAMGSQWTPITGTAVSLDQSGGKLNVLTTGTTDSHDDALYLSNFHLSTAHDFTLQATYSFTGTTAANVSSPGGVLRSFGVDFGIGTDATGDYSAAIGQGFASNKLSPSGPVITAPGGAVATRNGGYPTQVVTPLASNVTAGTFVIHYDSTGDDLAMSEIGGGSVDLGTLVRGTWHADELLVSLGGRGDSEYAVTNGQAFFSQFTIVEGTVVPEPAALTVLMLGAGLMRRRRRGAKSGF